MVASWQHRQQVLLQQVVDPANLKQHLNYSSAQLNSGNKVTRVYYRVVNQGPSWRWLHLKCLVVFGNQVINNRQSQPASNISLAEGQIIFSGPWPVTLPRRAPVPGRRLCEVWRCCATRCTLWAGVSQLAHEGLVWLRYFGGKPDAEAGSTSGFY
ncbi:hypothetical protein COO60DRAFT_1626048 [Scenedesmus sp. NREL 46B-D3]|nr:hypothetical protein COO60DRAFT_1626048 [Scenedesmus sp. NREL 46B-D3]